MEAKINVVLGARSMGRRIIVEQSNFASGQKGVERHRGGTAADFTRR
jgi:hypothetical protein